MISAQTMVYLIHSETLSYDQQRIPDAQILNGNVLFRHDDALMFCDSAYFYEEANSFRAYSNVRMLQGDTLAVYGDSLFYNGNTKIAYLYSRVRLIHKSDTTTTILASDSLIYNRQEDVAYYTNGGVIRDNLNTLSSINGQYQPAINQAFFHYKVHLQNPQFILQSDTLVYNTETHIADIVSPTDIVYEKSTTIYSSLGWYNTENQQSMLLNRSLVNHSDSIYLTGDTIFYDKRIGFGRVLGHMQLIDSADNTSLYGCYGEMWEDHNRSLATDSALFVDWSDSAHWTYLHADTLRSYELGEGDSATTNILAFHNVRIYRDDMQAVCDSMAYIGSDSIATLYYDPICWSDNQQVSADTIRIFISDEKVDSIYGIANALMVMQETDSFYNQMQGKWMVGYVRDESLRQVNVSGNALTIFYPQDEEDSTYIGLNTTESSYIQIYLQDEQLERVVFTTQTNGTIYPLDQIPDGKDHLSSFFWADRERPKSREDVFSRPERTPRPKAVVSALE